MTPTRDEIIRDALAMHPELANKVPVEEALEYFRAYAAVRRAEAETAAARADLEAEIIKNHGSLPWGWGWT